MSEYLSHPFCSNRVFSKLHNELLSDNEKIKLYTPDVVDGLFKQMITEADKVLPKQMYYTNNDNGNITFSAVELFEAVELHKSLMEVNSIPALFTFSKSLVEYYREQTLFTYNNLEFALDCKCRYANYSKDMGWGFDIWLTNHNTEREFHEFVRCNSFDRKAVFQMKVSGAYKHLIIGISRVNKSIYSVPVLVGNVIYKAGEEELNKLALLYWTRKYNRKVDTSTSAI